ncbi:MAG: aspartate 1-decarboxylase [bacterium]|nr:aspartate 1-decarboxylase [bacterium]
MYRRFLLGKIHSATVTGVNKDYEGSIEISPDIYERAGMAAGEIVAVFNIDNGERFETYVINGKRGSGDIKINGAAAHKASIGDKVIILSYCYADAVPPEPKIIILDGDNKVTDNR